jgi:3-isopropylmalate dehydrogenase
MHLKICVVAGDGIGPEVTVEAVRVLETVGQAFGHTLALAYEKIGGAALLAVNDPLPPATLDACLSAQAVLLGAVGGPAFDSYPRNLRPEAGLLRLRRELGAYANLRPAVCYPALIDSAPLKADLVRGANILIVRELLGGLYFGEPRSVDGPPGDRLAINTMRYRESEIQRIARIAFELARTRRRQLLSVDKANVLECSRLWRDVVSTLAADYPDVKLSHMYVDSAAMSLVMHPISFDVILTENMFGDILSDQAGGVVGSLGLLASASIGGRVGLFEPVHGSAPDIAGKGIANPMGAILSVAMLLRHSFHLDREAECVEKAVSAVLDGGAHTSDLATGSEHILNTAEMGNRVVAQARETASQLKGASLTETAH